MPYEIASGSALALVEALQRTYTVGGTFSSASTPSVTQVNLFLRMASAEIATMLLAYGYNRTQSNSEVLAALQDVNALGASWFIEVSMPSAGWGGEEPTGRMNAFSSWRKRAKELINSDAFRLMGATKAKNLSDGITFGGASISDKQDIETDTDFEPFLFSKDKFRHPDSVAIEESTLEE